MAPLSSTMMSGMPSSLRSATATAPGAWRQRLRPLDEALGLAVLERELVDRRAAQDVLGLAVATEVAQGEVDAGAGLLSRTGTCPSPLPRMTSRSPWTLLISRSGWPSPLTSRTAKPVGSLPAPMRAIVTRPPLPSFRKTEMSSLPWLRTTRSVPPSPVRCAATTWLGAMPVE